MRANNTVKFTSGKYVGLLGTVEEINAESSMVMVNVTGIVKGEGVTFTRWFKDDSLEVVRNG
jgi:transcription antitermination factor NusG